MDWGFGLIEILERLDRSDSTRLFGPDGKAWIVQCVASVKPSLM